MISQDCPEWLLNKCSKLSKTELREQLQDALEWKKENSKFEFYEPNGQTEKFIEVIGQKGGFVNILSAANSVGKTSLVVNIFANLIWPEQNNWFSSEFFTNWEFPKRIRYITDPKLVEEIGPFHSEVEKWWPKGKYEAIKSGKQYFSQYKAKDWVIDVMTYDQEVRQFEGGTMGMVVFDEPPPRSIWHACIARLRLGGVILVVMTPLTSAGWFYDEVVPKHRDKIVYASMEDACKQHGVRGHLEHDQIQRIISEMDPEQVEARAYGRAMYLSGLIFKNFDYSVHVAKAPLSVPEDAKVWHIVDPHIDKPFAMMWGYWGKDGVFYQIAEWPNQDFYRMRGSVHGIQDYKNIIKQKEQGWNVTKRIIDRHFAETRNLYSNRTLREDFRLVGIPFDPSYSTKEEVDSGILRVRSVLNYNVKKPIDSVNCPKYMVSPTCLNTIKGFLRWTFDERGHPKEEYKDFMDLVRYAMMANMPSRQEPPPRIPKQLYG